MPLDQGNFIVETKPDLSKPSLEALSWLLRHLATEQPGHRWNFSFVGGKTECGSAGCAIGVARARWGRGTRMDFCFDLPFQTLLSFFDAAAYGIDPSLVTPEMVADRIDCYLASRPR